MDDKPVESAAEFADLLYELFPSDYTRKRAAFQSLREATSPKRDAPPPKRPKLDSIEEEVEPEPTTAGGDLPKGGNSTPSEGTSNAQSSECMCSESETDYESDSGSGSGDAESEEKEHRITLVVRNGDLSDEESDTSGDDPTGAPNYVRQFRRLVRGANNRDEVAYFKENLTLDEQASAVSNLERISKLSAPAKPYCLQLLDTRIPDEYKAIAYRKMTALRELEPGSGEHHKLKQWMTTLLRLPFGKYKSLPVSLESNTIEECSDFISSAKETLDAAVFGMTEVKEQIYQLIGQWVSNPDSIGTAIAIEGPMGTGKTTLVREGISKALGRDFIFMALGGATDSSFLEGHSYTYEGAKHGKIVEGLTTCTSMNPVFFFDELDKVSDTARGQEIIGVLTHLTDSSQNTEFHDKYFAELSFDLSRALFVFSYNDRNMISPILRDRMHKLCTRGYTPPEKISISRGYLLPTIRDRVRFDESMVSIPDDVIQHIVDKHTQKEKGVRNLGRCLGVIYTKVNLARLVHDTSRFMKSEVLKGLTVPLTLTKDQADALLGAKSDVESWRHMYM